MPMFISHKKGLKRDGHNPTLLYGYGGFNISLTPTLQSVRRWPGWRWAGVYAQPNLRGGGEYGEDWHQAGTKLRKQNVFDDFIAAAEWLIARRYTSTPKLAIAGGSNGGLLVGACLTQRPDLFGAACRPSASWTCSGSTSSPIGWAWVDDYGSSDDPEQFKALYAYSPAPQHQAGRHAIPPTLITTGRPRRPCRSRRTASSSRRPCKRPSRATTRS